LFLILYKISVILTSCGIPSMLRLWYPMAWPNSSEFQTCCYHAQIIYLGALLPSQPGNTLYTAGNSASLRMNSPFTYITCTQFYCLQLFCHFHIAKDNRQQKWVIYPKLISPLYKHMIGDECIRIKLYIG
jgi:hypothetical protein